MYGYSGNNASYTLSYALRILFFLNHYNHYKSLIIKLMKLNKYLAVLISISDLCSKFDQFVHLHSMPKIWKLNTRTYKLFIRNSFKSLINIIIAFMTFHKQHSCDKKNSPISGCCTSKEHVEYIKFNSIKSCCECK